MSQLYTLSAAVKLLEDLEKKCNDIQNSQTALPTEQDKAKEAKEHLLSAKNILNKWERVLGGTKEILDLCSNDVDLYSRGDTYRSRYQSHIAPPIDDDFVNWAIAFNGCATRFHEGMLLSLEKEKMRRQLQKRGAESSVAVDKRRKILIVLVGIIATLIGVAVMVLLIINIDEAQLWATVLGVADFIVGIVGFCVERISDMKAQHIKNEIAQVTQQGVADIEKQDTVEAVQRIARNTEENIVKIVVDQSQHGIVNIQHGSDDGYISDIIKTMLDSNEGDS